MLSGDITMLFVGLAFGSIGVGCFIRFRFWLPERQAMQEAINYWREDSFRFRNRLLRYEEAADVDLPVERHDLRWANGSSQPNIAERFRMFDGVE